MHCSNCDTELPNDAKFCPECGAEFSIPLKKPVAQNSIPPRRAPPAEATLPSIPPRRAPPSQVPENPAPSSAMFIPRKTRRARRASASRIIISLILIFAVIGSAMAVITLTTWGSYKGDARYTYAPSTFPAKDSWSFSTDSANMNIQYTTNISAPEIQVAVHYDFAGAFLKGKTAADVYTLTFDNASKHFSLARTNVLTFAMLDNSSVLVTLNPTVIFSITASIASGNLAMTIPDGIKVGDLSMTTVSGNNHLVVGNNDTINGTVSMAATSGNVNFTSGSSNFTKSMAFQDTSGNVGVTMTGGNAGGNIMANTTSGNVYMNIANVTLASNIRLDVGDVSGNVILTMDQRLNPTKNVLCYLGDVSGNVDVNYKARSTQSSALLSSTKVSGTINCINNGGFESLAGGSVFQTMNQGNPSRFDANVAVVSGNIHIIGQMFA